MSTKKNSAFVAVWLVIRELLNTLIRFLGIFMLVRYISPKDFGIYSAALGLQQFFAFSLQMGINVFIVKYNESDLKKTCDSVFTLSLLISVIFLIISLTTTLIFSKIILFILFIILPFSIVTMIPQGLLEKDFKFGQLAKVSVISQLSFYVIALPLAIMGLGVLSLVIGLIALTLSNTLLLFYFSKYKPSLCIDHKINKRFLSFGIGYSGSIIGFASKNLIQPLIIIPFGGAEMAGVIALSTRLIESLNMFSETIKKYSISVLALVQNDVVEFRKVISKGLAFQVIINGFILVAFNVCAPIIVPLLAGDKWNAVFKLFPFISIFMLISSLSTVQISAMQIKGNNYVVTFYYLILNILIGLTTWLLLPQYKLISYGLALIMSFPSSIYLIINVNKKVGIVQYSHGFIWLLFSILSLLMVYFMHPLLSIIVFTPLIIPTERKLVLNFLNQIIPEKLKYRKINLYWFNLKEDKGNFGDALSPYIIKQLSGINIRPVPYVNIKNGFVFIIRSIYRKLKCQYNWKELFYCIETLFLKEIILSIGSIIEHNYLKKATIWGSGLIDYNSTFQKNANFLAVRGKLTQQQLKACGVNVSCLGDPAILLPLIHNNVNTIKKYEIGVIPHHTHYSYFKNRLSERFLLIDLTDDINTIINEINSCKVTISSSLHGLIVSHAYAIPSIWFNNDSLNSLHGGFYKFRDYFSSVGICCQTPYKISTFSDEETIKSLIIDNCNIKEISENIHKLQNGLLSCAPFVLKEKYRKCLI